MLVVIAILAGLLLPALAKAKAKARAITCVSNLKQLTLGAILYADDHDQIYPPNNNQGGSVPSWVNGILGFPGQNGGTDDTNLAFLANTKLSPYTMSQTKIYHCPSDPTVSSLGFGPRVRSYAMNGFIMGDVYELQRAAAGAPAGQWFNPYFSM